MRNLKFTPAWVESIRDTKRLEAEHKRKHPMVYGWMSPRFEGKPERHVPMLAYEWRREWQWRRDVFQSTGEQ